VKSSLLVFAWLAFPMPASAQASAVVVNGWPAAGRTGQRRLKHQDVLRRQCACTSTGILGSITTTPSQ
jgi:hypothetical protein